MSDPRPKTARHSARRRMTHPQRIFFMALMSGAPAMLVALIFLWRGDYTAKVQWTLTVFLFTFWLGFAAAARHRVEFPLQTLSNLLAALREGDFSIRARGGRDDDALGQALLEVNSLSETLRQQRLQAMEATALLRRVIAETDVAIFTFDDQERLKLVNRAGERLLAQPAEKLLNRTAEELGLDECLQTTGLHARQMSFPGKTGRFEVRRSSFRQDGLPHQLVVLADVSAALREEERLAWQRLVRVLGHELNNSLAPIKSIAGSLASLLARDPLPDDWQEDMHQGLNVIAARADSLSRFIEAYSRLARLPRPKFREVALKELVERVVSLETRLKVALEAGPELTIRADADQLEQLLINIIRNAVDAAMETGGGVRLGWSRRDGSVVLWVEDEGPGLSNTGNLFVPFFTTKRGGSGIGLVLSRQIAEAHGGTLNLANRASGRGCQARLQLPLS